MSEPKSPKKAKLVISVFLKETSYIHAVSDELTTSFGHMDLISCWLPFDYTQYYEAEMGAPLFRRLFSFKTLIEQETLPDIKWTCISIEKRMTSNGNRLVNIDPGYLLHERFVLATGKNYSHRIYIGKGIYADLTFIFQQGQFKKLDWTYPDYADTKLLSYLSLIRKKYSRDLKELTTLNNMETSL
ncbi:MAG: DUF4416 family protein [Desulfobacterales bacterium]|nr:DUF4416 family protein [Desulfobacterales bacterium]